MLDARMVAASTQGFAPAAHSESERADRIAPSAHGVALGFAMRTPIVETERPHESPPIRGYSPDAGKSPQMSSPVNSDSRNPMSCQAMRVFINVQTFADVFQQLRGPLSKV